MLRWGGRERVKTGFLGIVWLWAFRDAAREGAVNSYCEARARKVSPRITRSPPYSNKLTLTLGSRSTDLLIYMY